MLYTYDECIRKYKNDYQIKKEIQQGRLFKIKKGVYSDTNDESDIAVIVKKYPDAVFTLNSAFYYHGLTDTIPTKYYLQTDKDASKIRDESIQQTYDNNKSLDMGTMNMEYDGTNIKIFTKERLLVELIRNKSKFPFDYYKEIISNYRKEIYQLDMQAIQDYVISLPKTNMVLEVIQREVL